MRRKKNSSILLFSVLVFLLFFLSCVSVLAGYCANPGESSYYCGRADQEDCCPSDADYYDEDGAPDDQDDCEDNYYTSGTDNTVGGLCSDTGCCYISTDQECSSSSIEGSCVYDGGDWDTNGCDYISDCEEGCCIYDDGTTDTYVISSEGFCNTLLDTTTSGYFTAGATEDECTDLLATYTAVETECNDGVDNDGDGLKDMLDPGCENITDGSEQDETLVCDDGEDNDGDGLTDTDDTGCCENGETSNEELCEIGNCDPDSEVTGDACNCYTTTEEDGTYCASGNYCCSGECSSRSCGAACDPGEREYCGQQSGTGCLMYETCQDDGTWGDCDPTGSCGLEPEVCYDSFDQDGDGLVDCDDLDCYETRCDDNGDTSPCGDKGFSKDYGSTYVCCSTTEVNDCSGDGIADTCGSCECSTNPIDPEIDSIEFTRGAAQLTVTWTLACDVEFNLLRCTGSDCPTDTTDYTEDEILTAFQWSGTNIEDAWEYTDTTISPNERYCYVIQAVYSGSNTYSQPSCVDDSGDYWCQQISSSQFCLDNALEMSDTLIDRYGCTEDNQVSYIEGCTSDYGSDYICIGPDSNGETACAYQSDCATCGDPLGLYASLFADACADEEGLGCVDYEGSLTLCSAIPTCYFDYTLTTIDTYKECSGVSSCYDYASQSACEEQYSDDGYNNKCLLRDCEWNEFTSGNGISDGICKEKNEEYARCDVCNDAVHNGIFDACTRDRCKEFGVDTADCYLSGLTNQCTDIAAYTCSAYETSEDCSGDRDVELDISDGIDSTDTNAVITPSADYLGLGLCHWNGDTCYKDANGDGAADLGEEDMTPPTTIILSGDKMNAINVSILATDFNEDGSAGSGVMATYYCLDEEGSGCYPDELVTSSSTGTGTIELGDGSGEYTLYYFSIDNSENLEEVQSFSFAVDKQGPVITIDYYVSVDTSEPYESSALTFEVSVDEEAYCIDSFETGESQIDNEYNDHYVTKFTDLTDGYYLYAVNCTDDLGNTGDAFVFAQVDADTAIFDSSPSYYVDSDTVTLSVKTLEDAECGFSENVEEESFNDMDEGFDISDEGDYYLHTRDWTLTDNGIYFFDVKCELSDGTVSDDEISFVYDDTAPSTTVVDSFGDAFDFATFYSGEDLDIYLACTDEPLYGLGCDVTYYCLDTAECNPTIEYDFTKSIEYDLSDVDRLALCYYSVEDIYAGVGGLEEDLQCTEIKVDSYDPELTITSPSDGAAVYIPEVTITGRVEDSDAAEGTARNTVTITVLDTEGTETVYEDIDANNDFSYTVAVTLESNSTTYNYITVYGTDRSGATTALETVRVRYTTELGEAAIWIEEPANGVSDEPKFDFTIGTYLEAESCGYSKNNASLAKSIALDAVASDSSGEYLYSAEYSIDESKDGIEEYVYVKCLLVNGVEYAERLILEYDSTEPVIEEIEITNSDGKDPPSIVESPLHVQLTVTTDDRTKCKYSFDSDDGFSTGMTKFTGYDNASYSTTNNDTIEDVEDYTQYTLYIACQNGAYKTSDTESISFTVDSSAASGMYLISPEVSGNRTFVINIGTTRSASGCLYGSSADSISTSMTAVSEKQYKTGSITVTTDGNYTYYFTCSFVDGDTTDYFTFPVDTSPPVIDFIEDGNYSSSNTSLSATWSASDSLTEIVQYVYSIGTKTGYNDTLTWTYTSDKTALVDSLNLKNQSTYYWNVKAQNEVGLWSTTSSSNGVIIGTTDSGADCDTVNCTSVGDVEYHPCSNGEKDNDETDVDCGGSCDACKAGSACLVSDDCVSLHCDSGICAESSCTDSIVNQGESDVDCGGNYCDACADGSACVYHRDCTSGYCSSKVCSAASCDDGVKNGAETGTDCGGSCSACETVSVDKEKGKPKPDVAEEGWSIWTWLLIILLLIGAGAGGYYGYVYYMKKKGKLPASFEAFGGLKTLGKQLPSLGTLKKLPQKIQMPTFQRSATQKVQQQKQQIRDKLFGAFEEKTKAPVSEKLPEQRPVAKSAETKPAEKTPEKKEAPKKLGEELVIKKPMKKGPSKAFSALDTLIKEKKNTKAQTSEIFFFILAIIIIGLILLFGVKYIMELGTKVSQIDLVQFKTDLEGYADEIRPVYGKWKKIELTIPAGIDRVCFVQFPTTADPFYIKEQGICQKESADYDFLMCQAWQDDTTRNVYTDPFDELDISIDLGAMDVGDADTNYLCIDTSSNILKIKMTGRGDHVLVEAWE